MTDEIPVIDIGDHLAGRPGALQIMARQVHDALTTVGVFVQTGHDVPLSLVEHTFAEARRFHAMPMEKKLALKLNEHNNGYMVMGRYAVRTSDLNNNDKATSTRRFSSSGSVAPMTRCCCRAAALSGRICGRAKPTCPASAR